MTNAKSNALLTDELSGRAYSLAQYGGQMYYEDMMFDNLLECDGKHYFALLYLDYFGDRASRETFKFINGPFDLSRQMNPVGFTVLGNAEMHSPDTLAVTVNANEVVWQSPRFEVRCQPPVWHVRGRRDNVALDLTYRACVPAFVFDGGMVKNAIGRALWHWTDVTGTLELGSQILNVTGRACHEHTTFQQMGWRMVFDWITGFFGRDLYFVLYVQPIPGQPAKRDGAVMWVSQEGSELFNFEDVTIDPVATWTDAGLGQDIAQRWHIVARSARATLAMEAYAVTRIWHIAPRPEGAFVFLDYNVMLEGEWSGPDGRHVPLSGGQGYLQAGWPNDSGKGASK